MPQLFGFEKVDVPGPFTLPLLGPPKRFYDFLNDPVGTVLSLRPHGDVVAVVDHNPAVVCVYGPDRNREVLSNPALFRHDEDLFRGPEGSAMHKMRNALVTINGDQHRRHRKLMQPAFQKSALDGYASDIVAVTRSQLDRWPVGEVTSADGLCRELALCVAVKCLYGVDVSEGAPLLGRIAAEFVEVMTDPRTILAPLDLPGMSYRRGLHLADEVVGHLQALIEQKRQAGGEQRDAMALLMAARDDAGQPLSDAELAAEAMTLFIAGHETTAMTLAWTLFLLERHPAVLASVLTELDLVLAGQAPTPGDAQKLVVLDRVIKESMRVLAPVPVLFLRVCAEKTPLGRFVLPKNANVLVSPIATHHDPAIYPDPTKFLPQRWEGMTPTVYAYLPFGAGPRTCVGALFAERALRLILPMILQKYRFSIPEGARIDRLTRGNILLFRRGLPMRFEPFAPFHGETRTPAPIQGDIHELVQL